MLGGKLQKQFFGELLDLKLSDNPLKKVKFQSPGEHSRIDAFFELELDTGGSKNIYFENKTFSCQLTPEQVNEHVNSYCKNKDGLILIVTPRYVDHKVIEKIDNDKIILKTWSEILSFLDRFLSNDNFNSSLIKSFLEYAEKDHELIPMELITKKEISKVTSENYQTGIDKKFTHLFAKLSKLFDGQDFQREFFKFGENKIQIDKIESTSREGRHGIFFTPVNRPYGQWFFYGIYFDPKNHRLPLKEKHKHMPELAFFFDIDCTPEQKTDLLSNGQFKRAIDTLVDKKEFEENLRGDKANRWRLLFKRIPLSDFNEIDFKVLEEQFKTIFSELTQENYFWKTLGV